MKSLKQTWAWLSFSDVTPLMKELSLRPADDADAIGLQSVLKTEQQSSDYPVFADALPGMRKNLLKMMIHFEKPQYKMMFGIHVIDVHVAILGSLLSVQVLRLFEKNGTESWILNLFSGPVSLTQKGLLGAALVFGIFVLNILAASLHAQKIEREMLVYNRLKYGLCSYLQNFVFAMSGQSTQRHKTGDIINMAQADAARMAAFFAHGFVDFPVLFISVTVIMYLMHSFIGSAAWIGLLILMMQIPLSALFSWLSMKVNAKLMRRSDERISIATEWISAPRIIRYFGWSRLFEQSLVKAAKLEFHEELKLKSQWSLAFAFSTTWSFFVCIGIFAGFVIFEVGFEPSKVFASIWLASILGHQLNPLPWFINTFSEARVGATRIQNFLSRPLQSETFGRPTVCSTDLSTLTNDLSNLQIGYELENVSFSYPGSDNPILSNVSLCIHPGTFLAITGSVGVGKSTLLLLLLGELNPQKGVIWFSVVKQNATILRLPVHSSQGLEFLRKVHTYVPQEAFVANATLAENVPLQFFWNLPQSPKMQNDIVRSLAMAELALLPDVFPKGLQTEIGERGVNLSGGQKQRLSLARSVFANSRVALLDDPLSAVDENLEDKLIADLFEGHFKTLGVTLIWCTHRLRHLDRADTVLEMTGEGGIKVVRSQQDLERTSSGVKP